MPAPMPFDAPVTTATLFVSLFIFFLWLESRLFAAHFDSRLIDEGSRPKDSMAISYIFPRRSR
jgi:hypothetical protein